jgi:hypothetical protein
MSEVINVDGVPMLVCEWFAKCTNGTLLAVDHPILGKVPCCGRCINKMDIRADKVHAIEINVE